MTIGEVELGRLDIRLIFLNKALVLLNQKSLVDDLLLGDAVLAAQRLEPGEIRLGLLKKPGVVGELPFCQIKRRLEGSRIDLRQKVALVDELPFLEANLHQLPVNLGLNGDRGERRDSSEAHECLIDLAHADLRGADWLNLRVVRFSGAL